jgi:hypothetical protein
MNWMCSDTLGNSSQAEWPAEFGVQDFDDVLQPMRSARLSLCRMLPGKLIEQLDGRGFEQQSGAVVRVAEGLVRAPRQPGDLAVGENERFLGLQFVFPQRRRPPGFEFYAEYCPATVTERVAVSFPCGMVQDVF